MYTVSSAAVTMLFIAIILCDLLLALLFYNRKERPSRYLRYAALGAAIISTTYLISIHPVPYFIMSLMNSIYFICVTWMLVVVLFFVEWTTARTAERPVLRTEKPVLYLSLLDTIFLAVNPFREITVGYTDTGADFVRYVYDIRPLYRYHLLLTYALVLYIIYLLVQKILKTPRQYRGQFTALGGGILLVTGINALFLYLPMPGILSQLDVAQVGYTILLGYLYWCCYKYTRQKLARDLSMVVFQHIGQGVVLFDYEGRLAAKNNQADLLLASVHMRENMEEEKFLQRIGLTGARKSGGNSFSHQLYLERNGAQLSLRCDFSTIRDDQNNLTGTLYVFTDAALETDLLTGFHKWDSFKSFSSTHNSHKTVCAAVFDINGLALINSTYGTEAGDRQLRQLSEIMRQCISSSAYFVRGRDAYLITMAFENEQNMTLYCRAVRDAFSGNLQYAIASSTEPLEAIRRASESLQIKKLLDRSSAHHHTLSSLVRALQECDSDTEAHVQRTQDMGQRLAMVLGLNDTQQSQLRLLCLLHDIGKIGIPLEILNKPGKLTAEESAIVRTHVEKGYQIAQSSDTFSSIAEMILHHHERWDGRGYPSGLSKESIPFLSRIIAIVDAYDAMVNSRVYHNAVEPEAALAELQRCAGSQFDPHITAEFIQMIRSGLTEKQPGQVQPYIAQEPIFDDENLLNAAASANVFPVLYSQYTLDVHNRIISTDANFEAMTGYSPEDVKQRTLSQNDLLPAEQRADYFALVTSMSVKSSTIYLEHTLLCKDGSHRYVLCCGQISFNPVVKATRVNVMITDVTGTNAAQMLKQSESERAQQQLRSWEKMYRTDSLTGLLTRSAFLSDGELSLITNTRPHVMLMLDVDHFKEFNDTYGHAEGDKLLQSIAGLLQDVAGPRSLVCRMGGDEFTALLIPDCQEDKIPALIQALFNKLDDKLQKLPHSAAVSMGAAISGPDCSTMKQMYQNSDIAMYRSKSDGRRRVSM